jgi:hypothetical protein
MQMKYRLLSVSLVLLALIIAPPVWGQTSTCPPNLSGNGPFAKPLTDCFAELVKRADALENALKDAKRQDGGLPVGTILASYLRPLQFAQAIGEVEGDALAKRTWILSDGREVIGTKFAVLTGGKPVPNLSGMFLRGLPSKSPREPGEVESYSTALPKSPFTGLTSTDLPLTLPSAANPSGVDRYNAGGKDYPIITAGKPQQVPAHFHTVLINGGGDEETRPTNVAVFYYIKIN